MDPELDYIVKIIDGDLPGRWLCGHCGTSDTDVNIVSLHMRNDHAMERCRMCAETFTCMFMMDRHYQDIHGNSIPIDCKVCGTLLPDSGSLTKHLEWHNSAERRTEGNDFSKLCYGCGDFYARGQDFQNHRAICREKPFTEQGD